MPAKSLQRVFAIGDAIAYYFCHCGRFCSSHQVATIVLATCLVFLMCYPALETYYITPKNAVEPLFWELQSARREVSEELFREKCSGTQPPLHVEQIMINATDVAKGGILEKELLLWSIRLMDKIASTEIIHSTNVQSPFGNQITAETRVYRLKDLCYKPLGGNECLVQSPLSFWDNNEQTLLSDVNIIKTLQNAGEVSLHGIPMPLTSVFGDIVYTKSTKIKGAKSIILTYFLKDRTMDLWEKIWEQVTKNGGICPGGGTLVDSVDLRVESESKHLYLQFNNNPYDHKAKAEYILLFLGYLVGFLYVSLTLGRLNLVKSKFGLGFAALAQVFASLTVALSICSLLGFKLTIVPWEILPFMIMIIGVDNIFQLTNAVTSTSMQLPVAERVAAGILNVGPSMTKRLCVELILLLICAAISVDSVQEFCLFTSLSVVIEYILQMTFFVATLSIDIQRLEMADLYKRQPRYEEVTSNRNVRASSSRIFKKGRTVGLITVILAIRILTRFYPTQTESPATLYESAFTTETPEISNKFYETSATDMADSFWRAVNPNKTDQCLELRTKYITIHGRNKDAINDNGPLNAWTQDFVFRSQQMLKHILKSITTIVKYIIAPAAGIAIGISYLVAFLLSTNNGHEQDNGRSVRKTSSMNDLQDLRLTTPRVVTLRGRHAADVDLLCAGSNGVIISTSADKRITSWEGHHGSVSMKLERYMRRCESCKCGTTKGMKQCIAWPVRVLCTNETVELAAAGFEDGVVRVWDIQTGQAMHILKDTVDDVESVIPDDTKNRLSKERVTCLQFLTTQPNPADSPTTSTSSQSEKTALLAAYRDGFVREWDLESGQMIYTIATNQKSGISCLCIDKSVDKDLRLFTGARDGSIRCWLGRTNADDIVDVEPTGRWKPLYTLVGQYNNAITCIATKIANTKTSCYGIVVAGAADGEVRVYDCISGNPIATLSQGTLTKQQKVRKREEQKKQQLAKDQQQHLLTQRTETAEVAITDTRSTTRNCSTTTSICFTSTTTTEDTFHQGAIKSIIIHLLQGEKCLCGRTDSGEFWVITSSLDEKVNFYKIVKDSMDCSCMALQVNEETVISNGSEQNIRQIATQKQSSPKGHTNHYRIKTKQAIDRWDGVGSYRTKLIGRVSQPGGCSIVLLRGNIIGVRRIKRILSTSATRKSHGVEGEWEVWMKDLKTCEQDCLENENGDDLTVRTMSLVDEKDLLIEDIRRKKEVTKKKMQGNPGEMSGFVRRRRVISMNVKSQNGASSSIMPSLGQSCSHDDEHHHSQDDEHHHSHDHHDNDHNSHTHEEGQVVDFRQKPRIRRPNIAYSTKSVGYNEEEEKMNELLPFAYIRQVVKIGEDGVCIAYGNFVKVVWYEDDSNDGSW
ncbi:10723_t:CDS:2 [Paraglomus brasilianum]|uniref:Sterol regulatory element-binding protein cleavage-activating protein n=1 Tax=Paraglomus brasilianum TaxID=144538 RepID=A0A9N8WI29_9GLOM|nr:10723_t:CDS:2 [Paraglomus brasilianum]